MGAIVSLFFGFRENYFASMREGYGDVYADKLMTLTPNWIFYVMIILAFIGEIISDLLGKAVLKNILRKLVWINEARVFSHERKKKV